MSQTLYLNNRGDKWVVVDNDYERTPMDFMLVDRNGSVKKRRGDWFESFGNFAVVSFRYKGKRASAFFESFERIDGYPVVRNFHVKGE